MNFKDQDAVSLLQRMADGDMAALEAIYLAYQRQIFDAVRKKLHDNRSVAEDIVHQTFEEVIHDPHGYDPRKGPFIAWLQGIAHFKVMDYFRSAGRHVSTDDGEDEESTLPPDDAPGPGAVVDEETRRRALLRCLDRLPHEQRDTVVSGWIKEMTYADVAQMLGVEVGTVKSRIHNAFKRLKDCMQRRLGAEAWQ